MNENEKLMMGLCLTYSLLNPQSPQDNHQELQQNKLQAFPEPPVNENIYEDHMQLVPVQNAVTPYSKPQQEEIDTAPNFDLMELINETLQNNIPDEELLLAATQSEKALVPTSKPSSIIVTIIQQHL